MEVKHQPRSFASAQFSLIITLKSIKVLALEAIWVGSSISFLNCNDLKRAFSCLHSGMDALLAEKSVFRSPGTITSCPSDNAPSNILSNRKLCCLKIRGGGKERSLLMRGSSYWNDGRNDEDDSILGSSMDWISNEGLTGLSEISSLETVWTTLKNLRHFQVIKLVTLSLWSKRKFLMQF